MQEKQFTRCAWAARAGELDICYHDREWGVPVFKDKVLFEFLTLEGAQAGLSWSTILKKRKHYQKVFCGFDPQEVAKFSKKNIEALLKDAGIVRNRLKIESTVANAKAILEVRKEFGSFSNYIWGFVDGAPIQNRWKSLTGVPPKTKESTAMSEDLKKRGFRFVGPTTCYAFMQAVGMVNDHEVSCFRYRVVGRLAEEV